MSLTRRDVFVAAMAAGAGAMVRTEQPVHAADLPSVQNLQILMRGLFLVDTVVPQNSHQKVTFHFVQPRSGMHAVALTARLADLKKQPDHAVITLGEDGTELATWVFNQRASLEVVESGDKGVEIKKAQSPKKWDDIAWVASVPELAGVKVDDFKADHETIRLKLLAETGKLRTLSPSNKAKGEKCWTVTAVNGTKKTAQLTDCLMYQSRNPASGVTIKWNDAAWAFVGANARISVTSLPPPGGKDLLHFPHLVALFGGQIEVPTEGVCGQKLDAPLGKRESGTAYCPPGKRP